MPEFKARHGASARRKAEELAPYIERAMARIPPLEHAAKVEPIESYPVLMSRLGVDITQLPKRRRMGPALDQIERSARDTSTH
jgi:hypothetical protein